MERTTEAKGRTTRLGLLAGVLAVAALLTLAVGPDAVGACERQSLSGTVRKCTLTENFAQCITDSEDAYWQCRRRNPGFWGAVKCSLANNVDQLSCVMETGAFAVARGFTGG